VDHRHHIVEDRQLEAARIKELRSVISANPFRASAHTLSSLSWTCSRHHSWDACGYPNARNSHSIAWQFLYSPDLANLWAKFHIRSSRSRVILVF
jgi:hypothetical protein